MSVLKTTDPLALRLLFSDELYLVDEVMEEIVVAEKIIEAPEQPVFNYLGENNKYFLLLVNQPGNTILNAKHLESLTSILNAKKMDVRDVAILNLNKYAGISFDLLKAYFVNTRLVLFGIKPEELQMPAMPANKISEHKGVKILPTFSFDEMSEDAAMKRIFWNVMKLL